MREVDGDHDGSCGFGTLIEMLCMIVSNELKVTISDGLTNWFGEESSLVQRRGKVVPVVSMWYCSAVGDIGWVELGPRRLLKRRQLASLLRSECKG